MNADDDLDAGSTIALLMTKHKLPMSTLHMPVNPSVSAAARARNVGRLLPPISLRASHPSSYELDVSVDNHEHALDTTMRGNGFIWGT